MRRIADGVWAAGGALPSEPDIATDLGVSHGTVRKALDELAAENLVVRRQGKGTFVARHDDARILFQFFKLMPDTGERKFPDSRILGVEVRDADAEAARILALRKGAQGGRARAGALARRKDLHRRAHRAAQGALPGHREARHWRPGFAEQSLRALPLRVRRHHHAGGRAPQGGGGDAGARPSISTCRSACRCSRSTAPRWRSTASRSNGACRCAGPTRSTTCRICGSCANPSVLARASGRSSEGTALHHTLVGGYWIVRLRGR